MRILCRPFFAKRSQLKRDAREGGVYEMLRLARAYEEGHHYNSESPFSCWSNWFHSVPRRLGKAEECYRKALKRGQNTLTLTRLANLLLKRAEKEDGRKRARLWAEAQAANWLSRGRLKK